MFERFAGLIALGAVLAVPFLLRPPGERRLPADETLVIITPHNEPIRYEFARAFREHERVIAGRSVRIDWRVPGGSSDISRYLASQYAGAFENVWKTRTGRPFTAAVAAAFANPAIDPQKPGPDPRDEKLARRTFLDSDTGVGIDLLFGGGSNEFVAQAAAGRLVDSGVVARRPDLFGDRGIPQSFGGLPFWDKGGRWVGTCLSGFGICYSPESLRRLGMANKPSRWSDLTDPALFGQVALADPSVSGSAARAFEMVFAEQMNQRLAELDRDGPPADESARAWREELARREGWDRGLRLIRRIAANARYFTDSATKVPLDVASGDAAAGMCIDFYGRFQSEVSAASASGAPRIGFAMPASGSALDADPIGLLRGAPHRALAADFIEFVVSEEGQKLWDFRVGTPQGPEKYALRRLPILPALYAPSFATFRSDPEENPYDPSHHFAYHAAWTGNLFRAIAFVVRVACVDTQQELARAYRALVERHFPPHATALFDDDSLIGYEDAAGPIRETLAAQRPLDEAALSGRLVRELRERYEDVEAFARRGE